MKFLHIFLNYIKFTINQGTTFWLVLLYPILLIAIIGSGLNFTADNKLNVAVYGDDPIFDELGKSNQLRVIKANALDQLNELVRSKRAIMGVSIALNKSRKEINIYMDSTKQAVASNLILIIDKAVNEEKMKSGESLKAIQAKLAPKLIELKKKQQDMDVLTSEIQTLRTNASDTEQELTNAKTKLAAYRADLLVHNSSLSTLDQYVAKLQQYNYDLQDLYNQVSDGQTQRDQALVKISYNIQKIDTYIYKIDNSLAYIANIRAYTNSSQISIYLDNMENELTTMRADLITAKSDLISAQNTLNSIDFYSIKSDLSAIKADTNNTKNGLSAFKTQASSKIAQLVNETDETNEKISYALNGVKSFGGKLNTLEEEAVKTKSLMLQVIIPLEEFLGKKPEELVPPQINSISVFSDEKSINMFFPSILGIDIILASLLLPMIMKVRMRDQGVELRMIRSKASSLSVIVGEMLANYLISLFQLTLIFLFGIVFFGVSTGSIFGFLVVLLTLPLVFTSLGVFLSQVVHKSSTAFLLSLLISIPMIFISGTIIPIEFLSPIIRAIGSIMPLYIMIDFAEKLFFRNLSILEVLFDYSYLLIFSAMNLFVAWFAYAMKK